MSENSHLRSSLLVPKKLDTAAAWKLIFYCGIKKSSEAVKCSHCFFDNRSGKTFLPSAALLESHNQDNELRAPLDLQSLLQRHPQHPPTV